LNADQDFTVRLAVLEAHWLGLTRLRIAVGKQLQQMEQEAGTELTADLARSLDRMARYTESDQMYVVSEGAFLAACYALTPDGDRAFWTPAERRQEALYLDSVMVHPFYARHGLGGFITRRARQDAADRTMNFLRLDCQRGNAALRAHWEKLGFTWLRDVTVPGRASGTLMETEI
jgi:GNAT superfamily N-acetyltransferase